MPDTNSVCFLLQPAPTFAPAPAPAPVPIQPPSNVAVAPGGSSANPAGFGAPSGGVNVRTQLPRKGELHSENTLLYF